MGGGPSGGSGQGDPLVGGAMTANMDRIGELLEKVARDITLVAQRSSENCYGPTKEVLEARLGPLLRAGQAMRYQFDIHNPQWSDMEINGPRYKVFLRIQAAWDAALATLEGRDGK